MWRKPGSAQIIKNGVVVGVIAVITVLAGLGAFKGYEHWQQEYLPLNHVINSPSDISNELIQKIITNDIDSLTINYEFTSCNVNDDDWKKDQNRINPFWRANNIQPLKRIEFEVKLSPSVHSLACAFVEFRKLEYVNIKDTSKVADMSMMFSEVKSFNQPIGNWDTSKQEFCKLLRLRVPDVVHHFISRGRGKIGVLCIHKSLPPTIYWT